MQGYGCIEIGIEAIFLIDSTLVRMTTFRHIDARVNVNLNLTNIGDAQCSYLKCLSKSELFEKLPHGFKHQKDIISVGIKTSGPVV